jgi:hypothetical protein
MRASVPGNGLSARVTQGLSVLTKLGVSSEFQDLLILQGKEALRGCQGPVTSPSPHLDPVVRDGLGLE